MPTRWQRVLRGFSAAFVATSVAAFAHVVGGGMAPDPLALGVGLAAATLISIAVLGGTVTLPRLVVAVAASELAFHMLFGLRSGTAVSPAAGHLHAAAGMGDALAGMHSAAPMQMSSPAAMALSHAVAALVTVAALHRGERVLRRLVELAGMHLARLIARVAAIIVPAADPELSPTTSLAPRMPRLHVVLGGMRHRGPPRPAGATAS